MREANNNFTVGFRHGRDTRAVHRHIPADIVAATKARKVGRTPSGRGAYAGVTATRAAGQYAEGQVVAEGRRRYSIDPNDCCCGAATASTGRRGNIRCRATRPATTRQIAFTNKTTVSTQTAGTARQCAEQSVPHGLAARRPAGLLSGVGTTISTSNRIGWRRACMPVSVDPSTSCPARWR